MSEAESRASRAAHEPSRTGAEACLNLPAKVLRPDAGGALARPRLFRALDQLVDRPITWLHAAAGSGKTTLLASYLHARRARALWYEVDGGDADVSSLFHYVRLAAQALVGDGIALPSLRPASPEAQRIFGRRFFEALFAQLPAGSFLVFDNYQEAASEPAWNEMFRELCSVLTPAVRVLVASRVGPPPPLARFFAQGDLQLLASSELQLDEAEVQLLSRRGQARSEPAIDSARLLALTGGWAVAVTLLAKSSAAGAHSVPGAALQPPDEDLQSVFDFLAAEVFEQLDSRSQELLPQVAILPSFTSAMAAELTGRQDAAQLLAHLHRNHLLIERHGESGFRLHDLFRLFLRDRGALSQGESTRKALAGRAALLLAGADQFPAAVELLAEAQGWDALGDLIEQQAPVLASQHRFATLGSSLARLPPEHREPRPWLSYWRAVCLLGRLGGEAHVLAERAHRQFRASGDAAGSALSCALVVQAIVTTGENLTPLAAWLEAIDQLELPVGAPEVAAKVASSALLGHAFWDGSAPHAVEVADRAIALVGRHGTPDDRVLASGFATFVYIFAGHSERIPDLQRLVLDRQSSSNPDPLAKIISLHCEAVWALTQARLTAAAVASEQGLAFAQASGIDAWNDHLRAAGAMSAIGRRDFSLAQRILDPMLAGSPSNFARGYHGYVRGWLAFEQGDLEAAVHWNLDSIRTAKRIAFSLGHCHSATSQVIYEATRGNAAGLRQALDELAACLGAAPSPFLATSAELARIYARLCLGEHPRDGLRAALKQARRVGIGVFLGSRVVARLVAAALEYEVELDFAHELLRGYALTPGPDAHALAAWPWPVKIRALGPLEIVVAGQPLQFGRKPPAVPLALLKLLVAAGEPLTPERLSIALWPATGARATRGSLDTALYRLRKLLGTEAALRSENGHVVLDPQLCWTDTRAFALTCTRIAELASGEAKEPLQFTNVEHHQQKLLDLYRGPLGTDADPPPVSRAREQLRRRFQRAAADLERLWLQLGEIERRDRLVELASARNGQ